MTFNDNARSSGPRASRRGRGTGIAIGGGGLGVLALVLISQLVGVDLTGLAGLMGGGSSMGSGPLTPVENCETGADANANTECRVSFVAESLDAYWEGELGAAYTPPPFMLFEQSVTTACGNATSAVGPFYCPPDQTVYLDISFYDELRNKFGAEGGPLAQMYVVAHEFGHHIQNIQGTMDRAKRGDTGPTSDSVKIELQADCYAGAWAGAAATTPDQNGTPFLKPITQQEMSDALNAASVIGDDRIQETMSGQVHPESWTHGSSAQRQKWFHTGYENGAAHCDTFAAAKL